MAVVSKVAISMPKEVLEAVEKRRRETGESRSEFVRRAIEEYFRHEREEKLRLQYIEGYLKYPETEEELELARVTSRTGLTIDPWKDED